MIMLQKWCKITLYALTLFYSYTRTSEPLTASTTAAAPNSLSTIPEVKTSDTLVTVAPEEPTIQVLQLGDFDPEAKRKAVVNLVERGVKYLKNNDA